MKYCHMITMNVFVKPENILQDPDISRKTLECIKGIISIDWDKEDKQQEILKTINAEGFENRKIIIHELHLHKESHTTQFINNLMHHLTIEQKQFLTTDKHARLDENLEFFIRLDKNKLLNNIYELTTSGDCFHIKMNIAAFPKKRETALKVIDEMLKID
jgi:RNA binding exosome subunit